MILICHIKGIWVYQIKLFLLGYHAVGGPITVEVPTYYIELREAVYEAAAELGFEIVDSNAEKQLGKEYNNIFKRIL